MDRLAWQWECVSRTEGVVLNVGSKEDPARLKASFGARVLNCDILETDFDMGGSIAIDIVMDATKTWPFEDNSAELVVMCEILEHLSRSEATRALTEASRVAQKLCVTIPCDDQLTNWRSVDEATLPPVPREHLFGWDRELIELVMKESSWNIKELFQDEERREAYSIWAIRA